MGEADGVIEVEGETDSLKAEVSFQGDSGIKR